MTGRHLDKLWKDLSRPLVTGQFRPELLHDLPPPAGRFLAHVIRPRTSSSNISAGEVETWHKGRTGRVGLAACHFCSGGGGGWWARGTPGPRS